MESMKSFHEQLENLRHQVRQLTSAGLSLTTLFAEEAKRLGQEDEASRLRALHRAILEQLERAKSDESTASYAYSQVRLRAAWGGLIVGTIIKMASSNRWLQSSANYLLENLGGKKPPFGKVLVCIGPKGLPDDVRVVSVSQLARESNQDESEVINNLEERGCLLFSEEDFSILIDKLVNDVLEGHLHLPVPTLELSQPLISLRLRPLKQKGALLVSENTRQTLE
jgi:hypothetical protein